MEKLFDEGPVRPEVDDDLEEALTYKELVVRDAHRSPRWRSYMLDMQVFKIMEAKDRSLPMAPAARSPRHIRERSIRIVMPVLPKSKGPSKKRNDAEQLLTLSDDKEPWTFQSCLGEFRRAIVRGFEGFLEQDLEVQLVIIFVIINTGIFVWGNIERWRTDVQYTSQYVHGHAPPLPPQPPMQPGWTTSASSAAMGYALQQPISYLVIDFGIAIVIGIIVLFWEDLRAWNDRRALRWRNQRLRAQGYETVGSRLRRAGRLGRILRAIRRFARSGEATKIKSPRTKARELVDPNDGGATEKPLQSEEDLRMGLTRENDLVEELEIKLKVYTAAKSPMAAALAYRLKLHKEKQALIKESLKGMIGEQAVEKGSNTMVVAVSPPIRGGVLSDIANSGVVKVLKNSATGFISVFMFFADVASDIAVIVLLYNTGNYVWAAMAMSALVAQYVVMCRLLALDPWTTIPSCFSLPILAERILLPQTSVACRICVPRLVRPAA